MAYQSPAIKLVRPAPTFRTGYATGAASQAGASLWSRLSVAFAPFLGPTNNPTKLLFGKGFRPGNASFSGGRPAQSTHGWGWEFTSTSDQIKIGKDGDVLGTAAFGTVMVGFRKTDATVRASTLFAADLGTFDPGSFWLRWSGGNIQGNWKGGTVAVTPAAGYSYQAEHVIVYNRTETGTTGTNIYVDGEIVLHGAGAINPRTVGNADVIIGSTPLSSAADLMIVDFVYVFAGTVDPNEITALSADPGMMFRPVAFELGKGPISITDTSMAAAGAGSAALTLSAYGNLAPAAAGAGSAALTLSGVKDAVMTAAGAGSAAASLYGVKDAVMTAAGAGSATLGLAAYGNLSMAAVGHGDAFLTFDAATLRNIQAFFIIDEITGLPVTGAAGGMTFELYADDQGALLMPPTIFEIAGGVYKFYPGFPVSPDRGIVYMLNTGVGHRPLRAYGYVRRTEKAEDDLPDLYQVLAGPWQIFTTGPDAGRLVVYDQDGVTPLARFPLRDLTGALDPLLPSQRDASEI